MSRRDDVGVEEYQAFKKFDIGDIIGVRGFVFRTKMGEISVHVTEIVLLSKSLLPLPEKIPRPEGPRGAVPPALCGPDRQPGGAQDV